jgi:hypothetical protein
VLKEMRVKIVRFVLLSVFLTLTLQAQTVSVGSVTAQCGQSVTVPVTISSATGMLALEFRVSWTSPALTFTGATTGSRTSSFALTHHQSGNSLRVAMASGTAASGSGGVANLSFAIAPATVATIPLAISDILVNDVSAQGSGGAIESGCSAPPAAPQLVSPLNGATGLQSAVQLSWSAAADASSYRVYYGTSPQPPLLAATPATSREVTAAPSTRYYWTVESINDAGSSSAPVRHFDTAAPSCTPPPAPTAPTAPATVTAGSSFTLVWSASTGATEYRIEEAQSASFAGAISSYVPAPATSLQIVRTPASETTYYYRLFARSSAACEGTPSPHLAVRVLPSSSGDGIRVLPVVGATAGGAGSFFRTSLQLHNAGTAPVSGRLVFHPAGVSGSSADPSLAYALAPGETRSWADVLGALGRGPGLGSLDITPDAGSHVPMSVTRIFNDAGQAGTSGMTLDQLGPSDALTAGRRGVILTPSAPSRLRTNVGIRSLAEGVTMAIHLRSASGMALATLRRTLPHHYFEQIPLTAFFETPLQGDESVVFEIESGSAMIYASSTDNVTNDPNVQIARPVP